MNDIGDKGTGQVADIAAYMHRIGEAARAAARVVARADTKAKNLALVHAAAALRRETQRLIEANARDIAAARAAGHDAAFVDRLALPAKSIDAMASGLEEIAALPDPVGEISDLRYRPS